MIPIKEVKIYFIFFTYLSEKHLHGLFRVASSWQSCHSRHSSGISQIRTSRNQGDLSGNDICPQNIVVISNIPKYILRKCDYFPTAPLPDAWSSTIHGDDRNFQRNSISGSTGVPFAVSFKYRLLPSTLKYFVGSATDAMTSPGSTWEFSVTLIS